jgi:hypothetical protein
VKLFGLTMEDRHFTFTDHKPITYAFHEKLDKCSPRQFSHLNFIAKFNTDIRRIPGQDVVVDNALSRIESVTARPSHDTLAASEDGDNKHGTHLAWNTALWLEKQEVPGTAASMYCDISSGKLWPYVRAPLRLQVFQSVHDLSHPGTKPTARLVAKHFVCPSIQKY